MEDDSKKEDKYHSAFGYLRSYLIVAILIPITLFVIHDVVQIRWESSFPIANDSSSLAITAVIGIATIGIAVIGILLIFFGFTARQDIKDRFEIYSRDVETLKKEIENVKEEVKKELKEESRKELDELREQLKSETKRLKEEIDVHSVERLCDTASGNIKILRENKDTFFLRWVLSNCSEMLNILSGLENPFENKKWELLEFGLTIAEGAISELPDTYNKLQTPHSILSILIYSRAFQQLVLHSKDQSEYLEYLKDKAEELTNKICERLQPLKTENSLKDDIEEIVSVLKIIGYHFHSPKIEKRLDEFQAGKRSPQIKEAD